MENKSYGRRILVAGLPTLLFALLVLKRNLAFRKMTSARQHRITQGTTQGEPVEKLTVFN